MAQLRWRYRAGNNFRAGSRGVYLESQHSGGGGRRTKNSNWATRDSATTWITCDHVSKKVIYLFVHLEFQNFGPCIYKIHLPNAMEYLGVEVHLLDPNY